MFLDIELKKMKKIKKKAIWIFLIFGLVLALILFFYPKCSESYQFNSEDNTFSYKCRGKPHYTILSEADNGSAKIYKIKFSSRNFLNYPTTIYGFVFVPKMNNPPGLVYLPAGSATKESRFKVVNDLVNLGYAVLIIDQRGIGETGGYYLGPRDDYKVFIQGKEPIQHLSVYDALRSYDVLKSFPNINHKKLAFFGVSMGGRYAMIAQALEKSSKGVLVISSSGFHVKDDFSNPLLPYFLSIDPDNYVSKIAPNKLVMIHTKNDSVIPIRDAKITFSKASEPKKFYSIEKCTHGYCREMLPLVKEGLEFIFS